MPTAPTYATPEEYDLAVATTAALAAAAIDGIATAAQTRRESTPEPYSALGKYLKKGAQIAHHSAQCGEIRAAFALLGSKELGVSFPQTPDFWQAVALFFPSGGHGGLGLFQPWGEETGTARLREQVRASLAQLAQDSFGASCERRTSGAWWPRPSGAVEIYFAQNRQNLFVSGS